LTEEEDKMLTVFCRETGLNKSEVMRMALAESGVFDDGETDI